ncbi:MAG: type VI secretion system baseplate subunit TssF [Planctomycetota bacterium]|nr:type VI secretion system baseplate subunit TssF [Planctomycetota bacterium]
MTDELLPFYNRELTYLRQAGLKFARDHPKIAGRLRLGTDVAEDPHVERLIEAVAFLNGRIQHRLDDEFPEISDALLGMLNPQVLAPVPSMVIARFTAADDATARYVLNRSTKLETERVEGHTCTYRTAFQTDVWPIEVVNAAIAPTPFDAPPSATARQAAACLRLTFRAGEGASFADLDLRSLRLHLRGLPQQVYPLYELLLNDTLGISLGKSATDKSAVDLKPDAIRPVGFDQEDAILPSEDRTSPAFRLLSEFFAFPQKFLFLDLEGLDAAHPIVDDTLEVFIYLRRLPQDLDRFVNAETFALNCSPLVNLFERRAEPIRVDHVDFEARVVPNARKPLAMEVYSIDAVTSISAEGESRDLRPFYGIDHGPAGDAAPAFWQASRRPADEPIEEEDSGTELYLKVVDLDFNAADFEGSTLTAETTCTNRDLPLKLPFGAGHPFLTLVAGGAVSGIECLAAPTRPKRPSLAGGTRWKLLSHLAINHLTLSTGSGNVEALRELLRMQDSQDSAETQRLVNAILELDCATVVARINACGQPAHCRGLEVSLTLDETKFSGSGLFLFASILEQFFGLYATVNSFTQLKLKTNMRDGVVKTWPPRAGNRPLL